jgi:hypothetical protein
VKGIYDPDGLFFVHHAVGSQRGSAELHAPSVMRVGY